jgi:hypothetical protein
MEQWKIGISEHNYLILTDEVRTRRLAFIPKMWGENENERVKRDAYLIVKAPEMLEALRNCEKKLIEVGVTELKYLQKLIKEASQYGNS